MYKTFKHLLYLLISLKTIKTLKRAKLELKIHRDYPKNPPRIVRKDLIGLKKSSREILWTFLASLINIRATGDGFFQRTPYFSGGILTPTGGSELIVEREGET